MEPICVELDKLASFPAWMRRADIAEWSHAYSLPSPRDPLHFDIITDKLRQLIVVRHHYRRAKQSIRPFVELPALGLQMLHKCFCARTVFTALTEA